MGVLSYFLPLLSMLPAAGPPDDAEPPLPPDAVARLGSARLTHPQVTSSLFFAGDGKTLISASHSTSMRFWDIAAGRATKQLANVGNVVAVSPDGKLIASVSHGAQITLRDGATGKPTAVLGGHQGGVVDLIFTPDGKHLLSAGRDRAVRMWDLATRQPEWSVTAGGAVTSLALSRDGKHVAACAEDKKVYVWEVKGKAVKALEGHTAKPTCVAFSADGKWLVSGGWDVTARVWDVSSGKQTRAFRHESGLEAVAFSPDGKRLATIGGADHSVYLWDLTTPQEKLLWKGRQPHGLRLAFSADGKTLASSGWDNTIRLWDVATGGRLPAPPAPGHEGWVYAVAALPNGKEVVSAGSDGQVLLWDVGGRKVIRRFAGHDNRVWCLAVAPDGRTFASGGSDQMIRVWDVSSVKEIRKIPARGHVHGLAYSPDGRRLAYAAGESRYPTWLGQTPGASAGACDAATGETKLELTGHDGGVKAIVFAPDGKSLATGGNDGTVRLWDSSTGKQRLSIPGTGAVEAVAFSPDGEHLAATGQDQKIRLFDAATGEMRFEVVGPKAWGLSLAFSPDGRTLVSAAQQDIGYDATGRVAGPPVRLWEVATGLERARFAGHQETAHAAAFSADGRSVLTGGADGCVMLWDVTGRSAKPMTAEAAWAGLMSENGAEVQRSVWALVGQPVQALPLLKAAFKPAARVDAARLQRLIKEMDDDAFTVREKATEELEAIGEPAAKALREAVKDGTAEVRTRAERLLEKLTGKGEGLRGLRAWEVLEQAEHAGIDELLKSLAKGDPETRLTKDAKATLARRARR